MAFRAPCLPGTVRRPLMALDPDHLSGDPVTASSAITIRPAIAADAAAMGRLGAGLVAMHHDFDASRFIASTRGTARSYASFLAGELERPEVIVLVAEEAGALLGYTYAGIEGHDYMVLRGPAGVVYDIVVDPAR